PCRSPASPRAATPTAPLTMLRGAGIGTAKLLDGNAANGQKVWRLRVGPLQADAAPELAARIVGLGFGQPQRVRD
ncbi:hypothetical protein ACLMLE_27745, partial [Lysobacter capsici]